jgi:hypothetical protein
MGPRKDAETLGWTVGARSIRRGHESRSGVATAHLGRLEDRRRCHPGHMATFGKVHLGPWETAAGGRQVATRELEAAGLSVRGWGQAGRREAATTVHSAIWRAERTAAYNRHKDGKAQQCGQRCGKCYLEGDQELAGRIVGTNGPSCPLDGPLKPALDRPPQRFPASRPVARDQPTAPHFQTQVWPRMSPRRSVLRLLRWSWRW